MVDFEWLRAKQQQLFEQNKPKRKKATMPKNVSGITLKLQFAGVMAEVMVDDIETKQEMIDTLDLLYALGFEKPVYGNRQNQNIVDQWGTVVEVKKGEKEFNGKPTFDVIVKLEDGTDAKVMAFKEKDFRAGDTVWYFKAKNGYAKIQFEKPETGDDIPF